MAAEWQDFPKRTVAPFGNAGFNVPFFFLSPKLFNLFRRKLFHCEALEMVNETAPHFPSTWGRKQLQFHLSVDMFL